VVPRSYCSSKLERYALTSSHITNSTPLAYRGSERFNSVHLLMAEKKTSPKKNKKTDKLFPCQEKGCDKVYKSASARSQHKKKVHSVEAQVAKKLKEQMPKLSEKEEYFCTLFASDREMFGNGVQSYIEAFDIQVVNKPDPDDPQQKTYQACRQAAHILLTNSDILKKINEIFEGRGLNDEFVDKQLEKVITQDAEFNPKMKGIVEYNKLKKRTTTQIEHTHSFAKYEEMSDEELEKALAEGEKFFLKK
jgi:hypothetical protein